MFDQKNTSTSLYKVRDSSLKGNISKMKEKEFKSRQMPSARICGSVAEFGIKAVNGQDCVPSTPGTLPRTPLEGGVTQGTEQRFPGRRTSSALSLLLRRHCEKFPGHPLPQDLLFSPVIWRRPSFLNELLLVGNKIDFGSTDGTGLIEIPSEQKIVFIFVSIIQICIRDLISLISKSLY